MTWPRALAALATSFLALAAIAALSSVSYVAEPTGRSLLRLSWRVRGERLERCRRATPEELAGVPAHMRQETICDGARTAPYRLRVDIDGQPVSNGVAPGSGVAGDRPMYVLREFPLASGRQHVRVLLERMPVGAAQEDDDEDESEHDAADEDDDEDDRTPHDRSRRRRAAPRRLELDTTVTVQPGAILLVTYDDERRQLVLVGPGAQSGERPPSPTPR